MIVSSSLAPKCSLLRPGHFASDPGCPSAKGASGPRDFAALDSVDLDSYRLTPGLLGGVTLAGAGLVAAVAAPLLGVTGGALAGGALFAAGVANGDSALLKGFGLAALGGALCATGAVILGAIPLALGLGTLAVVGLKMGG